MTTKPNPNPQPSEESMKIRLTMGQWSLVDAETFEILNVFRWQAVRSRGTFYAQRQFWADGIKLNVMMHHVVLGYPINGQVIDHVNGDGLDNRRENLRFVSKRENSCNRKEHRSGHVPGAVFHKPTGKYIVRISFNNKKRYIGLFQTEKSAARVYRTIAGLLDEAAQ